MTLSAAAVRGRSGIHSRAGQLRRLKDGAKKEGAQGGTLGSPMLIVEAIVSVES